MAIRVRYNSFVLSNCPFPRVRNLIITQRTSKESTAVPPHMRNRCPHSFKNKVLSLDAGIEFMKRKLIRTSLVGAVLGLGGLAIAVAQMSGQGSGEPSPANGETANNSSNQPLTPIPDPSNLAGQPLAPPFGTIAPPVVRGNGEDVPASPFLTPYEPEEGSMQPTTILPVQAVEQEYSPPAGSYVLPPELASNNVNTPNQPPLVESTPQYTELQNNELQYTELPEAAPVQTGPPSDANDPNGPPLSTSFPVDDAQQQVAQAPQFDQAQPVYNDSSYSINSDQPRVLSADQTDSNSAADEAVPTLQQNGLRTDESARREVASQPNQINDYNKASSQETYAPIEQNAVNAQENPQTIENSNESGLILLANAEIATSSVPGTRKLDGPRDSIIGVQKNAPSEIQVGIPADFETIVQNTGKVAAHGIIVVDQVPRGTRLLETTPQAQLTPDGRLTWRLGSLEPGASERITMRLMPETEGEIGSVAQVAILAQAGVRTICTRPLLTVKHTGPEKVLIGEEVPFTIFVTNPGTGAASNIVLEEIVPAGLSHAAGNELEYEIGTLRPQETKKLVLTLNAKKAGVIENILTVRGEGSLQAEHRTQVEVIAPQLQLNVAGPKRRFLERQAKYSVSVSNPGTAPANNVELVAYLPKGMKYITNDKQGQYDPKTHAVFWSLEELPPKETGVVELTMLPTETGSQSVRVEGKADLELAESIETTVTVDALAELLFTVSDVSDPIEVGSDTTYVIRLSNSGSKPDTNVRIAVEMPPGMQPVGGDGPTRSFVQGQYVAFEPLSRLAPKSEAVFKVTAKGLVDGLQLIKVQVASDELEKPVSKEEGTRVYSDG